MTSMPHKHRSRRLTSHDKAVLQSLLNLSRQSSYSVHKSDHPQQVEMNVQTMQTARRVVVYFIYFFLRSSILITRDDTSVQNNAQAMKRSRSPVGPTHVDPVSKCSQWSGDEQNWQVEKIVQIWLWRPLIDEE